MPDVQRLHVLQRKTKYLTAYSYHCGDFFIIFSAGVVFDSRNMLQRTRQTKHF
jgi:hypothetical protein